MNGLILLIDKNPEVSEIINIVLTQDGFKCRNSNDTIDIASIIAINPALIILHNGLNNMGSIICKALKADSRTKSIPVIMTSTRPELERLAIESRADAFMPKPFDISELSQLVKNLISRPTGMSTLIDE